MVAGLPGSLDGQKVKFAQAETESKRKWGINNPQTHK